MSPVNERAFSVTVLRHYSNYHTLKHFIVVAEKMPMSEDLPLKEHDEIVETKELHQEVVIVKRDKR